MKTLTSLALLLLATILFAQEDINIPKKEGYEANDNNKDINQKEVLDTVSWFKLTSV
ncbi:MAG: hypothetical protein K8R74_12415 [Bacteroidales bacterium]|nr:hypothetical protein [Bacteroidales bacterium]